MDWIALDSLVRLKAKVFAGFVLATVVSVIMLGAAWALTLTIWVFLIAMIFIGLRSRVLCGALSCLSIDAHKSPVGPAYFVVGVFAIATFPLLPSFTDAIYRTGKLGEPPYNRFIRVHEAGPSDMVLEMGVTTTALERYEVVLRFNTEMCSLETGGLGRPNDPKGPMKTTIGFSGHSMDNPTVYIANPGGRLTPRESVYLMFHSVLNQKAVLNDCRFQGPLESFDEGKSCVSREVVVIDLPHGHNFEPLAFVPGYYSVRSDGKGWCD